MPALGDEFRAAREARGLSLSDVAEQIHIRSVYLAQIERENWSAIGAPVYVRGFLRTYARFLGLDPERAVGQFNESSLAPSASQSASAPVVEAEARRLSPVLWVAGAVAAVLVAFVIYNSYTLSRGSPPVSRHRTSARGPGAGPSRVHRGPKHARRAPHIVKTLSVRLTALSWLRITIDGNVAMEGTFPAGTAKSFHGKRADVRAGNAGGVDLAVNGKHLGKLGAIGTVAERTMALQE